MAESIYCGDAAGRKADFSNDDLLFSINLGLKFYTPEMLFHGDPLNFPTVPGVKLEAKYAKIEEEKKEGAGSGNDLKLIEGFKKIPQTKV